MSEELHQPDTAHQRRRRELLGCSAAAFIALAFVINLIGVICESWDYNTYGNLGVVWFLSGIGLLVSQILTRKFRWPLVLLTLAIAVVAVCVNGHMVGEITASV